MISPCRQESTDATFPVGSTYYDNENDECLEFIYGVCTPLQRELQFVFRPVVAGTGGGGQGVQPFSISYDRDDL